MIDSIYVEDMRMGSRVVVNMRRNDKKTLCLCASVFIDMTGRQRIKMLESEGYLILPGTALKWISDIRQ
jgi:hypothetical protein